MTLVKDRVQALDTASGTRAFCHPFPITRSARYQTKQRVRRWLRASDVIAVPRRRSTPEFAAKMLPLVKELAFGLGDTSDRTFECDDASWVERVAARLRLVGDDTKVAGDGCRWIGDRAKTLQLRVPRVAASATEKHRLRKKRFAPQGYQAYGVEMARMESPEAHETL